MNFLAHVYLSGQDEELILGNFIADSVKGKKYRKYPKRIQQGILLHRAIDYYTDTHPVVRKSTSRLFKNYSHYSGVIVDIYYDHFLAANWGDHSQVPLENFTVDFYKLLRDNFDLLPARIQGFLPYMIRENWLLSYASLDGIARILYQMNRRTRYVSKMDLAVKDLKLNYEDFRTEFEEFFPSLKQYVEKKISGMDQMNRI